MSDDESFTASSVDVEEPSNNVKYLSPTARESCSKDCRNVTSKRVTVRNILNQKQEKRRNLNTAESSKRIRKANNGKRLKFKNTQEKCIIPDTVIPEVAGMSSLGRSENSKSNFNKSNLTADFNKCKVKSRNEGVIFEGGSTVNGYRFVYKSKDEIPDSLEENKKANNGKTFSRIYNDAHEDFNCSVKHTKIDAFIFQRTEEHADYSYEMYLKFWNNAKDKFNELKFDQILFPNRTGNVENLNLENLKSFILSAGTHSYPKNIKSERIRWHPDSMIRLFKQILTLNSISDDKIQFVITKTFQMINELWEQHNK
ncbi:hypothetical protein BVG19_g2367 [[Candida] boidinii]|nr:hypothetical protein BVG19_g2367 [[Candida] boidinii]OWB51389.1 hypothetical protein B5S27_g2949 [[Candida] boidinii]